jgi:peptidoglycan hydrolase-like protein with peptidoglycan-binding domain
MSAKNLGIILLSSVLLFTLAPIASAQSTNQDEVTMQKSTPKATVSKDIGKATTSRQKPDSMTHRSKDEVREIQKALKSAGFDPGAMDGILGSRTRNAIRDFQFDTGTLATGNLNEETLTTLGLRGTAPAELARAEESEAPVFVEPAPELDPDAAAALDPNAAALPGEDSEEAFIRDNLAISPESHVSSRDDMRSVQESLRALEYNPGEINGMMSSETRQAVREFQLLNGLQVTGNVDQQTKVALDAAMHGSNSYDTQFIQRQKPGEASPPVREAHPQKSKQDQYEKR